MCKTIQVALRCGLLMILGAVVLTGCAIPFNFNQVILKDVVLPADLANLPPGLPPELQEALENWRGTDEPIMLAEICEDLSLDTLMREAANYVGPGLLNRLVIRSARVNHVTLKATRGSFSSFTKMEYSLKTGGKTLATFSDTNNSGFGDTVALTPAKKFDLMDLLNDPSANCFENWVTVAGRLPDQDIKFDVILGARVRIWFKLF